MHNTIKPLHIQYQCPITDYMYGKRSQISCIKKIWVSIEKSEYNKQAIEYLHKNNINNQRKNSINTMYILIALYPLWNWSFIASDLILKPLLNQAQLMKDVMSEILSHRSICFALWMEIFPVNLYYKEIKGRMWIQQSQTASSKQQVEPVFLCLFTIRCLKKTEQQYVMEVHIINKMPTGFIL